MVLIGTVPSTISAVHSKYRINTFPPINCGGHDDRTYIFYSTTLPILAAVCVSLILMILANTIQSAYGKLITKYTLLI